MSKVKALRNEVLKAAEDYKYLLNRGYKPTSTLDLITSRYLLSREERVLLYRCVHSRGDVDKIINKIVQPSEIKGKELVIDGYNVILTVASGIEGRTLYVCDDTFVRDLRSVKVRNFSSTSLLTAIKLIAMEIESLNPSKVVLFLDRNVSWSAKHAEVIKKEINRPVDALLASKADTSVIKEGGIASSSDYLVLENSNLVFDLAGEIIRSKYRNQLSNSIYSLFTSWLNLDKAKFKEPK